VKWDDLEEEPCSMVRTIGVIGDRWTLLILRECFLRARRFEGFQSALGMTRHLLAERRAPGFAESFCRQQAEELQGSGVR
jgi:DNA-binding HxlR family transcriptional regulator